MKQELLESLQLTKFTRNSNLTAEHFLALYLQKFRASDELSDDSEKLVDSQKFMFLYNALSEIEDFRQIRQTMDIHNRPDDYDTFLSLVEKAAIIYDKNNSKVKVKHKINETNMVPTTYWLDENEKTIEVQEEEDEDDEMIDINQLVINKLYQQSQNQKKKFDSRNPKEPNQPFQKLPIELWKLLDQNAKNTIMNWLQNKKGTTFKNQNKFPPKPSSNFQRSLNNHEIDQGDTVDENQNQDTDDPQDSDALLSLLMSQDDEEQASLANVLSAYAAKRGKSNGFSPPSTKQIKFNVVYRVSNHDSKPRSASLIDRGANGGLAGNDVKVISTSSRKVDVAGLDNHTVNGLSIVTAAGLVQTNKGPMIMIMHQYAYMKDHKTIHCCVQLEHYKNKVYDKSVKYGGKQCLMTLDGVIVPFAIRQGLTYLDIRPPTDEEYTTLPHIIMTSDEDWDPSVADHEYDPENNFANNFSTLPYVHDPKFNEI